MRSLFINNFPSYGEKTREIEVYGELLGGRAHLTCVVLGSVQGVGRGHVVELEYGKWKSAG